MSSPKSFKRPASVSPTPDSRYVFILFGLIFVVLVFAFLIYFVYGQKQFSRETVADNTDFERTSAFINTGIDTQRNKDAPAISTTPISTTSASNTSTVATADISRYNPRAQNTFGLRGRELIQKYFASISDRDYTTACSLLSNTICNARRDIYSFSQFLTKTQDYQIKDISLASEQKTDEAIYCVEYAYTVKEDLNRKPVTEYFQYRIKSRPDGADEISARVCEKIVKDGRERPCPIITPKKYCF